MPATDRLSLIVESMTKGEESVNRLNDTLAQLATTIEQTNTRSAKSTKTSQDAINASLKTTTKEAEKFGTSIVSFIQNPIQNAEQTLLQGAAGMGKFAAGVAGVVVGVGAAGVALKAFIGDAAATAKEINSLAQSTGLTINQADRLRAAAEIAGFGVSNLKEAALDLSTALKDTSGQGAQTRDLLNKLGVAMTAAGGATRPTNEVLLETFDALSKISDTTTRVNLSRVLGGEDAAKNIQPLLVAYRQLNDDATKLGFGTREATVKVLLEAQTEIKKMDLAWEGFKSSLAAKLAPVLIPVLIEVKEILTGNGPNSRLIQQFNADAARNREQLTPSGPDNSQVLRLQPKPPGLMDADLAAGRRAAESFIRGQANNEESINFRLDVLIKQRATIIQKLSSTNVLGSARGPLEAELKTTDAETSRLNIRLEEIAFQKGKERERREELRNLREFRVDTSKLEPVVNIHAPTLGFGSRENLPEFLGKPVGEDFDAAAFSKRVELDRQKQLADRERAVQFSREQLSIEEQRVALLTDPGGEIDAINQIAELRKAGLQTEIEMGAEIFDQRERLHMIEEQRQLDILAFERKRRDEARSLATELTQSLRTGTFGDFLKGQGNKLIDQIGTNVLAKPMESLMKTMGGWGKASGLGSMLSGTLFDPSNAASATQANTAATVQNTAALIAASTGRAVAGTASGLSGMLSPGGPLFSGASASNPAIFSNNGGGGGVDIFGNGGPIGVGSPIPAANGPSSLVKGVGAAGAVAAGGFGAYSGIKKGGLSGALTATGSIAGMAATLLALSPATGPAAPILAGIALTAMAVSSFLPDPKKKRDEQLNNLISSAMYNAPSSQSYMIDQTGSALTAGPTGYRQVQVNINALDSQSVIDRREDIADAVRLASVEGHAVNRSFREALLTV